MSNSLKGLLAVLSVVVIAAAGWFGWQFYSGTKQASAPAVPNQSIKTAVNQDKLIEEIMTISGMKRQIEQMPEQISLGMTSSPDLNKLPPNIAKALEKITVDAFAEEKMAGRMMARLKEQFNEKHAQALLADLSTPLAKRMVALETNLGTPEEQAAFFKSLSSKPLPASRISALQALDNTTKASKLSVEMANSSSSAILNGMLGDNPEALAKAKQGLDQQRSAMEENVRNSIMSYFAYLYRDASDADLSAYTELHTKPQAKWFTDIAMGVTRESLNNASKRIGERFASLLRSSPTSQQSIVESKPTPAAPQASQQAAQAPAEKPANTAAPATKPRKPSGDIQHCLKLEDSRAIAKCAERYR